MALAKTAKGTQLLIKIGDGADPEVFAHSCTINAERGIQFSAETNDVSVPDCTDPELLAWVEREKRSLSATINGAGVLNGPDADAYFDWLADADPKNVKVVLNIPGADGGVIFSGAFHLTQFELSGTRGEKVNCTIRLESDGAITVAANS